MRRLYERHHDVLCAFIRMHCDPDTTASDVMHDTMPPVRRSAGLFSAGAARSGQGRETVITSSGRAPNAASAASSAAASVKPRV